MIEQLSVAPLKSRNAVLGVTLVLAVAAAFYARGLKLDALPDITPNQVVVLTTAPGFTPDEVELLVTRPVEVALSGTPGLVSQRSVSRYGVSQVVAEFPDDVDPFFARQVVQERLLTVSLPGGADTPALGPPAGGLGEVYHFSLRSPVRNGAELLSLAEVRVRPILARVPGVVEVNTWGGERMGFSVAVSAEKLAARGLTLADVQAALEQAQGTRAGAALRNGRGQAYVRATRRPQSPDELGDVVVGHDHSTHAVVRLSDVARLGPAHFPRVGAATGDGEGELVYVMVQMLRGANALELSQALDDQMALVRQALPEDVAVDVIYDRAEMVSATLATVGKNLVEGGLLVIFVLFLMLGSVRAGLIVAAVIPLSMLIALAGMTFLGIPGNLMSLGAIDFGLLVDGAVVVTETLFHVRTENEPNDDEPPMGHSVQRVLQRVARPVFYAMLIIVIAYLPILLLSGVDGKLFRPMASTVVMALLAALVLSLVAVPAAIAAFVRDKHIPERPTWLARGIQRVVMAALRTVAPRRWAVAAAAVLLLALGGGAGLMAGTAFVPQLDEGDLVIQTTRSPDIDIHTAVREAGALEAAVIADVPEVKAVYSRIGSPAVATDVMGLEQADVFVRLYPKSQWRPGVDKDTIIQEMQKALDDRGLGGDPAFTQPIQMRFNEMLGGDVSDIAVSVFGDDLDELRAAAEQVKAAIEGVPGAADVRIGTPPEVPVREVVPDPVRARRVGLSEVEILDAVAAIEAGVEVGETLLGTQRIPLVMRLDADVRPFQLPAVRLAVPGGELVHLSDVAFVKPRSAPSLVSHNEGQRRVVVGLNVRGADLGDVTAAAQAAVAGLSLPEGVWLAWGGQAETLEAAKRRIMLLIPLVLGLIVVVLLLALGRLRSSIIVLAHVPFASVGGVLALTLRGMPISISAAVGFIALSGIAILNGVVLMSEILRRQDDGASPHDAALDAARVRARPVMMTAMVAALGFLPMMLSTSVGAEVQRPLATVIVGGLVTSTLLTLLVLPSLYPWFAGAAAPSDQEDA